MHGPLWHSRPHLLKLWVWEWPQLSGMLAICTSILFRQVENFLCLTWNIDINALHHKQIFVCFWEHHKGAFFFDDRLVHWVTAQAYLNTGKGCLFLLNIIWHGYLLGGTKKSVTHCHLWSGWMELTNYPHQILQTECCVIAAHVLQYVVRFNDCYPQLSTVSGIRVILILNGKQYHNWKCQNFVNNMVLALFMNALCWRVLSGCVVKFCEHFDMWFW